MQTTESASESSISSFPFESRKDDAAGIRLLRVDYNHVGIVAVLEVHAAVVGNGSRAAREALGSILRVISDSARQVGRSAPLLGLLVPGTAVNRGSLEHWVTACGRDQDWHRGDFILRCAADLENAKVVVREVLIPFEALPPKIGLDRGEAAYLDAIRERLEAEGASPEVTRLLRGVLEGRDRALEVIDELRDEAVDLVHQEARAAIDATRPTDEGEES